jgi:hypothetical protein
MYSRSWLHPRAARRWALTVALLATSLSFGCGGENALLLTLKAESFVDRFDLLVRDLDSGEIVLERKDEQVDPDDPNRDISQAGQGLRVSIEFASPGRYLLYVVGRAAGVKQVALRDFEIDGVREETVKLKTLTADLDRDNDGFPSCAAFTNCTVIDSAFSCRFLDCDDSDPAVNPFAQEICGNGKDDDCDKGCGADPLAGDITCVDNDGDGVPTPQDCDDNDPCRSPAIKEGPNLCGGSPADYKLPQACLDKLAAEGKTPPVAPFCGDGVDQSCSGGDAACVIDEDCDGPSPPQDCNDKDPKINPSALELCDGVDNNCNGTIDEGCVPCDVDGDGHALASVTDPACTVPKDDPDDFDAGIYPGSTKDLGGKEGGSVRAALRGWCRSTPNKDGTPERDVDHDGDGRLANQDCPPTSCDGDGDGFERSDPAAGCTPTLVDCDDTDPKIFPGAPDKCGDAIAQNCQADKPCTGDSDGDGYLSPDDCNDSDPNVHPWATEVCDLIDNDCDGLINENNPDRNGALVPTTKTCTDDNDGECGKTKGTCACSKQQPTGERDTNNRTACADEDLTAAASPRCFGAAQWAPERCDNLDRDCDGGAWSFIGVHFADLNKPCSIDSAQCKKGVVVGCNPGGANMPNHTVVQALHAANSLEFNPAWRCSPATKLPTPERCNGKDDDCNGSLPSNEQDPDGDKYIACGGCNAGDLASGLSGCSDCSPSLGDVYPGAAEQCNDRDDDCNDGKNDDGDSECGGGTPDCCSSQQACRNLSSDINNCGDCGKKCTGPGIDRCAGGKCVCGNTGGACPSNLDCVSGTCQCIPGGRCGGCCDGNTCRTGSSVSNCGKGGVACKTCDDSDPCTADACNSSGTCTTPNAPNVSTTCPGGVCINGSCCTTCRSGSSTCVTSLSTGQCGTGGALCQNCSDGNACTTDSCSGGSCSYSNVTNGGNCPGGKCVSGNCCTGCVQGASCVATPTVSACGAGGSACSSCIDGNPCTNDVCSSGSCSNPNRTNGAICPTGRCAGGSCCGGCRNGDSCLGGTATSACGAGGIPCTSCSGGTECQQATCSGSCGLQNLLDGTSCQSGAGECLSGACCTGCDRGGSCRNGDTVADCGTGGGACTTCTAGECQTPTCTAGGCGTAAAGDSTSCTGGLCFSGACCTGCWDGAQCQGGGSDTVCGSGGGACQDCTVASQTCKGGGCSA